MDLKIVKEKIVVLIPAYNPDDKMLDLISELDQYFNHIVVVNDGCKESYDYIFEKVSETVSVVKHEENKGKGRALKTGFKYIVDNISDALGVITVDADGQHTTKDVLACCETFLKDKSKAVFGCRDFHSDTNIPPRSRFGNRLTSKLMKFFCDITLSDTQTGLRLLPFGALTPLLDTKGERYEYEMNMIFDLKDMGIDWIEQPISVIYIDDNESSHFNPIKDSFKIYKVFIKFCLSSFGSAILDIVIFTIAADILNKADISIWRFDYIITATVIARVCSGLFNFFINKWIFNHGKKKTTVIQSGSKYFFIWLVQMSLSAFLVSTINMCVPFIHGTLIKIVVDTLLFFISYKIQQKWVFK